MNDDGLDGLVPVDTTLAHNPPRVTVVTNDGTGDGADGPPKFRDATGKVVGTSGGPRIKLPPALAAQVMALPIEERMKLAKTIMAHREKEKRVKKAKVKRRAKAKDARKARRK